VFGWIEGLRGGEGGWRSELRLSGLGLNSFSLSVGLGFVQSEGQELEDH